MTETRLRDDFPFTAEWYEGRERAPHWEQPVHHDRLRTALLMAQVICFAAPIWSAIDIGCGDGGLLAALDERFPSTHSVGFDISPEAVRGAEERGVRAFLADIESPTCQPRADLVLCTETLEHLNDPHGLLERLRCHYLIASSPFGETSESHDACHVWAWDRQGYRDLIADAGFQVVEQLVVGEDARFQVVMAVKP